MDEKNFNNIREWVRLVQSIGEILLPRMAHLSTYIQSLLDSSLPSGQQNTLRVYSVLLVSGILIFVTLSLFLPSLLQSSFLPLTIMILADRLSLHFSAQALVSQLKSCLE